MGSLTDLIGNLRAEKNQQSEKVFMLSNYMTWRNVPPSLFKAVREHLLYLWETNKGYDAYETDIQELLTPVLRRELRYHIYGRILKSAPFLAFLKDYQVCLKELACMITPSILSHGDSIFRIGEPNEQVYILVSGIVRLSLNESLWQLNSIQDGPDGEDEEAAEGETEAHQLQMHAFLQSVGSASGKFEEKKEEESDDEDHPEVMHKAAGKSLFAAKALRGAAKKLEQQDMRERWAARFIQRQWHARLDAAEGHSPTTRKRITKPTVRSKSVESPAYFGESCLWEPFRTWGCQEPNAYMYSARCETRCEVLIIDRSQLRSLIEHFSPWLEERFDFFRQQVLTNLEEMAKQRKEAKKKGLMAKAGLKAAAAAEFDPPSSPERSRHSNTDMAAEDLLQSDNGYGYARRQLATIAQRSRMAASRLGVGNAEKDSRPRHARNSSHGGHSRPNSSRGLPAARGLISSPDLRRPLLQDMRGTP